MRLIEEKIPTEKTYLIELTQSEIDALGSVIVDLAEPVRECRVEYPIDGDTVVPTDLWRTTLKDFADWVAADQNWEYDYFDWFESYKPKSEA